MASLSIPLENDAAGLNEERRKMQAIPRLGIPRLPPGVESACSRRPFRREFAVPGGRVVWSRQVPASGTSGMPEGGLHGIGESGKSEEVL